jgi:hypothetical protein
MTGDTENDPNQNFDLVFLRSLVVAVTLMRALHRTNGLFTFRV